MKELILKKQDNDYSVNVYTFNNLFFNCVEYLKNNVWQSVIVVVTLVFAFGFKATHFTYHIDMLIFDYYSGYTLIGAGRFSAPIISFLTNWMQFAPFWHTAMMMLILFFSGLIYTVLLKNTIHYVSNYALFSFWVVFATFPIISYQLTCPILSVVLPYLLIGISLWLLFPIFHGAKITLINLFVSIILITISVDMYESHATVYLTTICFVLFFMYLKNREYSFKTKNIVTILVKLVSILVVALVLDFVISKIVCHIFTGTFEFWYKGNTNVYWAENSFVNTVKWIIREHIGQYLIAGVSNISVLLYDIAIFSGTIISIIISFKRRSVWCVLLYIACIAASLSLGIVIGSAPKYSSAQSLQLFVPFFVLMVNSLIPLNQKFIRNTSIVILGIIVINQTLFINRYSFVEHQRFQYENNILTNISEDLEEYSINEKPVLFISDKEYDFPSFDSTPLNLKNPIAEKFENIMFRIYDEIIPQTTYKRLNARYGSRVEYDLLSAENIAKFFNEDYRISPYIPFNNRNTCPTVKSAQYIPEIYVALNMLGCELIVSDIAMTTDESAYNLIEEQYSDMQAYPNEGYIIETEDIIIVKVYG